MHWRTRLRTLVPIPRPLQWRFGAARLFSWQGDQEVGNFGDHLSPELIRRLFGIRTEFRWLPACDLISTGSLLTMAETRVGALRPMVWGSGFIEAGGPWAGPDLDIRAVRGERTLERVRHLARREIALGDPGTLTPFAYPDAVGAEKTVRVALIPHHFDTELDVVTRLAGRDDLRIIDVMAPVDEIIDQLASAELVISSSLHGLIVAESYGIPNAWVELSDMMIAGRWKSDDFYSAFGTRRDPVDLDAVLADIDGAIAAWEPVPDLAGVQRRLLESFPLPPTREVRERLAALPVG